MAHFLFEMLKFIIILIVTWLWRCADGERELNFLDACHHVTPSCQPFEFNCGCENGLEFTQCIPQTYQCDGIKDCSSGSDEIDCICDEHLHQCGCDHGGGCSDEIYFCIDNPDRCPLHSTCYSIIIDQCMSGYISSPLCPTEYTRHEFPPCPSDVPYPCSCNTEENFTCRGLRYCYSVIDKCDGTVTCSDYSDEMNCTCPDHTFTCECFKDNPMSCSSFPACFQLDEVNDGIVDCSDASDETYVLDFAIERCGLFSKSIWSLTNITMCDRLGFPACDNSTCVGISLKYYPSFLKPNRSRDIVVCTSYCDQIDTNENDTSYLYCTDNSVALSYQFCDGSIHCKDGSDEIRNGRGFKCIGKDMVCVLPQWNLYDDFPHCKDKSDLCFSEGNDNSCFKCFDSRLVVSSNQVCDGIMDCHDLSDECLCQINFKEPICNTLFSFDHAVPGKCGGMNPACHEVTGLYVTSARCTGLYLTNVSFTKQSHQKCQTKWGEVYPTFCDGRPECRDFEDECFCENPPAFCYDGCHSFHAMGDRYCDGYVDEAWKYLNRTVNCSKGFDEKTCPNRYYCKAGNLISIDKSKINDGIRDCDDGSDEKEDSFSSDTEMIRNPGLKCLVWFMGVVTILGNSYVILTTFRILRKGNLTKKTMCNHILLLNLSFADLLMGIYLLIIAIKSVQYSGYYGVVDGEWRTSLLCKLAGSLAIVSSEASCFIMTILTTFRLYNLCYPFSARFGSMLRWKFSVALAWLVAIILGAAPLHSETSSYFVNVVWFSNQFTRSDDWKKSNITEFACRLASLTNNTSFLKGDTWESIMAFFNEYFPQYSPKGEFGYYGGKSVCLPRFYVVYGDTAWEYSIAIIILNCISFLYVLGSFIAIYRISSDRPVQSRNADQRNKTMQKRIARLLLTDFLCWIPICIMAFIKLGGIVLPSVACSVTAVLLLPINSAMNPLLYSMAFDSVLRTFSRNKRRQLSQVAVIEMHEPVSTVSGINRSQQ